MLEWISEEDDDYNTIWEAASPYTDGDGGSPFMFRLAQMVRNNCIWWVSRSDEECGGDLDGPWQSIEDAKKACQEATDTIIHELSNQ